MKALPRNGTAKSEQDWRREEGIREVAVGLYVFVPHLDDQKLNIRGGFGEEAASSLDLFGARYRATS